jgi:nicotinamidase-related amidase
MNQKNALLVMDMQVGILGMVKNSNTLIANVKTAIKKARAQKIPILYITVTFRKNYPEISDRNMLFSSVKQGQMGSFTENDAITQIHPDLAPEPNDVKIAKRRISAFAGSDLEIILRSLGVENVVLCGIATSGVVLSTTREAADKDYKITVLSDCCADPDQEVHKVLIEKVLSAQAHVISVRDWLK